MGPGVVDFGRDSLVHAAVFLRRMWKLRKTDAVLFDDLYFQMSGDTADIVSRHCPDSGFRFPVSGFRLPDSVFRFGFRLTVFGFGNSNEFLLF